MNPVAFDPKPFPSAHSVSAEGAEPPSKKNLEAAKKLEQLFMTILVKQMRKSIPNGLFGQSPGTAIFEGMFDRAMSESVTAGGGTPLRQTILASLPPESDVSMIDDLAQKQAADAAISDASGDVIHDTSILISPSENESVAGALLAQRLRSEGND